MLIFDNEGHTLIASAMKDKQFFLALADSDEKWGYDKEPRYNGKQEKVFAYIGEHQKSFVVLDSKGSIEFNGKRYRESSTPTNILLISFKLKGTELKGRTIRQEVVMSHELSIHQSKEINRLFLEAKEMDSRHLKRVIGENISPKKIEPGSNEVLNYVITF